MTTSTASSAAVTPSPAATVPQAASGAGTRARREETGAVRDAVDARLAALVSQMRERWAGLADAGEELAGCLSAALAGGKRARAVLAAQGAAVLTHGPARAEVLTRPDVVGLGAALELYQASALVHDDVIDHADTRRGAPATHRALQAAHRRAGWHGEAEQWGASAAILVGDLLLSLAGWELGRALDTAPAGPGAPSASAPAGAGAASASRVRHLFDEMTAEVAVGQYLDVRSEQLPLPVGCDSDNGDGGGDPASAGAAMRASALEVVRRKSARYSVMYPLLLGAVLAGVDPRSHTFRALARFGEQTGIAFQLRDDLLGVLGEPSVTGKPVGDDLREGKRTVLLAHAWQATDDAGRATLRDLLTTAQPSSAEVTQAVEVVVSSGAPELVEAEIETYLRGALEALELLEEDVPADARLALARTARTLARRSA